MILSRFGIRILVCGLVAGFACVVLPVSPSAGQGPGVQLSASSAARSADLLKTEPFDRITLIDNSVIDVEPISPRPMPQLDPNKKEKRAEQPFVPPPSKRKNRRPIDDPAADQAREDEARKKEEAESFVIRTMDGDIRDFRLKYANVKKVEYYEDLLIAESDRYIKAHDFIRAFERLLYVQKRAPNWPGLNDKVNKLLLVEGETAVLEADSERGLRLLRELYGRKKDYPGLANALASAYGSRISKAFDLGANAQARRVLHDLEVLAPDHPLIKISTERFINKAIAYAVKADKETGVEKLDDLTEALKIWPRLEGASDKYKAAFAAEPTLSVGVIDLPKPLTPWVKSNSGKRAARLVYLPVLADMSEESSANPLTTQLAAKFIKGELGLRILIDLRQGVPWSDLSREVSSIDVSRSLIDRADPRSPGFDARWADLLDRVETPVETRVEVQLTRAVLNPEAWFLNPIGPAHADRDGLVPIQGKGRRSIGNGPFKVESVEAAKATFLASGTVPNLKIHRLIEVRYPDAKSTIAALLRGDITMVEHVSADRVSSLRQTPEIQVSSYARPSLHRIAIDGRNPTLRNRTLRRALAVAIDRKSLLEETILKHSIDGTSSPSDGPFAKGSYADAPDVKPIGYDPLLARMLVAASKRELGGVPLKLKFEYPAHPDAQACIPKLLEMFKLAGLEIEPVERPEAELELELRSGRKFDLAYRINRCVEPANEAGVLISPAFDSAPGTAPLGAVASARILQLLLELDRSENPPEARGILLQIDRESRDELPIIPLWQLEDHYAWRSRLKGPAESTEYLYENIANWEVAPWYPLDPW